MMVLFPYWSNGIMKNTALQRRLENLKESWLKASQAGNREQAKRLRTIHNRLYFFLLENQR